ncbi:hypothetical protein F503_03616 [Ophiostoma piceae UAMH 11346]|uniref:Uncharacterized protein n=1 Tax=Ophiostoma piceae (strain UAMH 11346) TaxID=1262450 RepID=S3BTF5_OPHP1|nr:hypothetical protein F503_03616 [Ophiostoma piceae UAMH 11346]
MPSRRERLLSDETRAETLSEMTEYGTSQVPFSADSPVCKPAFRVLRKLLAGDSPPALLGISFDPVFPLILHLCSLSNALDMSPSAVGGAAGVAPTATATSTSRDSSPSTDHLHGTGHLHLISGERQATTLPLLQTSPDTGRMPQTCS